MPHDPQGVGARAAIELGDLSTDRPFSAGPKLSCRPARQGGLPDVVSRREEDVLKGTKRKQMWSPGRIKML